MKASTFVGTTVLVASSFVSWFVTSSVVAQIRTPTKRALPRIVANATAREANPDGITGQQIVDPEILKKLEAQNPGKNVFGVDMLPGGVACSSLQEVTATVDGRTVRFSAVPTMRDDREGIRYMWHFIITDAEGNSVLNRQYRNQIFFLNPKKVHRPTFKESIELAPGKYNLHIRIYEFPVGGDLDQLNEDQAVLTANRRVTVE